MNDRQLEIHIGLKAIGPEIAQYYLDGIELIESNIGSKSSLLAHILREIDGGLRDIFEQKKIKEEIQKKFKNEDLEKVFDQFKEDYKNFEYLSDITFEDFKKERGHISSILVSFGFSIDHPLFVQYIKVVRWLAKYAHRSGAYNQPRNPKDVINLWYEFEDVLSKLIGNYYALTDRIDTILLIEEPTPEVIKTLPNLLNNESRFIYFFNGLKSKKWLIQLEYEKYFDGSNNPEPIELDNKPGYFSIPYWGVLTYLEEVANQNLKEPNKDITESLIRIIESICHYRNAQRKRVENYRTDYTIFKIICTLPEEYLLEKHFKYIEIGIISRWEGLISNRFNEFLDRLITLNNKELLLKGVKLMLSYKVTENAFEKVHSIFRHNDLQTILSEFKQRIIPIISIELVQIVIQKISEVIELDMFSFNNSSIPAIEDHEQTTFPENYDCQLVYLIRDTLEKLDSNDIVDQIKKLLYLNQPIFQRIAFHIIRVRYSELKDLFWSISENPLMNTITKHEVYELIKDHSIDFSYEEITKIIYWIESNDYLIAEEFKNDKEYIDRFIAYRKKEWLSSLLPSKDNRVTNLIRELNKINNEVIEHPGFNSWHSSLIGNISPLTVDEIANKSIDEIISFYNEFKNHDIDIMGPSENGLIDMLILTVRKNPNKYAFNCESLINSPRQIKYAWISGLCESWKVEKQKFECEEVLRTILKIIQNNEFWVLNNSDDNFTRWFVSSLLSFIEEGLRDDKHAIDPDQLPIIKKILFKILENDRSSVFEHSNLSMTILNNIKGRTYMNLFQFSLRLARLEGKDIDRWDVDVKKFITQNIELKDDNQLLFFLIGQFLPNIQFLDENWMIQNFNKLFPLENQINWAASISGYFFHQNRPNKQHFKLFIECSHLKMALTNGLILGEHRKSLIQQICTAYLLEFESIDIDKEILQLVINTDDESVLSSIIYFFWSPRLPFEKKFTPKIQSLWIELYKRAIKMVQEELDTFILSGCCKWLNNFDNIDDKLYEVLLHSAKFVNQRDRYAVIEALTKHINNEPEKVGMILIEMFKNEVTYDISRGKLQVIVENLYEKGFKGIADKICLIHGENGYHYLRSIYIKYNA